jgi:hypothetical protein
LKIESVNRQEDSLHTRLFDKMTARKYFTRMERSLLRWDVDDYNNIMGAFLGLV